MSAKRISIKSKVLHMQFLLVAPILTMMATAFMFNDFLMFKTSIEKQYLATSKVLALSIAPTLAFLDKIEATKILNSLDSEPSIVSARVFDRQGELFAQFRDSETPSIIKDFSEICTRSKRVQSHFIFHYDIEGDNPGTICLEADLKVFADEFERYALMMFAVVFASFVLAYLLAYWLQHDLSRPIMRLAETTKDVSNSGDYSLRMGDAENTIAEIETFAGEFNRMLEQIQTRDERILHEKDAAEAANRAKSVFLANISHELRTPMHGILSFARFGQQKIDTASKEKIKSYFDEINDSGSRLMSLLNDLLDLSKLEAGKVVYSMKRDDLCEVVRASGNELRAFAEERGLKIEAIGDTTEAIATFDAEKMMQVLRNILSNAIKFSDKGSTIHTQVENLPNKVRCTVSNRGVGIPASELESVFDKFTQSSKTRTGAGGTGLGLAICKETIRQHGGDIWAESELNAETRFIIELPKTA